MQLRVEKTKVLLGTAKFSIIARTVATFLPRVPLKRALNAKNFRPSREIEMNLSKGIALKSIHTCNGKTKMFCRLFLCFVSLF